MEQPLSVNIVGGDIDVLMIPEPTFDQATQGASSGALDQTFLGVTLGGAIAIALMFATPELAESTRVMLIWALGGTLLAAVYLFGKVVMHQRRHRENISKIKRGRRFKLPTGGGWVSPPSVL